MRGFNGPKKYLSKGPGPPTAIGSLVHFTRAYIPFHFVSDHMVTWVVNHASLEIE